MTGQTDTLPNPEQIFVNLRQAAHGAEVRRILWHTTVFNSTGPVLHMLRAAVSELAERPGTESQPLGRLRPVQFAEVQQPDAKDARRGKPLEGAPLGVPSRCPRPPALSRANLQCASAGTRSSTVAGQHEGVFRARWEDGENDAVFHPGGSSNGVTDGPRGLPSAGSLGGPRGTALARLLGRPSSSHLGCSSGP